MGQITDKELNFYILNSNPLCFTKTITNNATMQIIGIIYKILFGLSIEFTMNQ